MSHCVIIYAHPDSTSFNAAILGTVIQQLQRSGASYKLIDLYKEAYNPVLSKDEMKGLKSAETNYYQQEIKKATDVIFIFPVWWFRAPAILEGFIDKTFIPHFAYRFKPVIGKYGIPIPLLKDKKVLAIITHGAPALPVKTLYVNVVKYRFLLGFLSFCFNLFRCKIVQLWSVPFVDKSKREQYLQRIKKIIQKRIKQLPQSQGHLQMPSNKPQIPV